jgi:ABC-type uncharacterized transport system auxiliary subunit
MITLRTSPTTPPPAGKPIARWQLLLLSGLTVALLLCGCTSRTHWRREEFAFATPADETGTAAHTNILSLRGVKVSPLFEGQALVYRTGENSYEHDAYAEFLIPPSRMLDNYLRISLRNGHAFAEVLNSGSSLDSSCSMEISVNELYGDFRQSDKPQAVLQLRFLLYSTEPDNYGRVLWQGELSRHLPVAHRTPAALVAGWEAGLQQIMDEVNADLDHLAVPDDLPPKQR